MRKFHHNFTRPITIGKSRPHPSSNNRKHWKNVALFVFLVVAAFLSTACFLMGHRIIAKLSSEHQAHDSQHDADQRIGGRNNWIGNRGLVKEQYTVTASTGISSMSSNSSSTPAFSVDRGANDAQEQAIHNNYSNKNTKIQNKDASDSLDCKAFLRDFRQKKISEIERTKGYEKSFVTRSDTPKPFYWSMHDPALDPTRASSHKKGFYYEKELSQRIMEVFENMASPNSSHNNEAIMLDVGGNLGWFSLLAAAHGATQVYMFEPNPANLVRFCESLQLNDWLQDDDHGQRIVYPIAKGVSNEAGKMKFYRVVENNPGTYSFSESRLIRNNSKDMKDAFLNQNTTAIEDRVLGEIELVTLDDFAENMGWFETKPTIAFFKLDVEGFEPQIVYGAKKLFEARLVEYFSLEIKPRQTLQKDKRGIIKILFNNGYDLYMHGAYLGPNILVTKTYQHPKELLGDISAQVYFENLLFRKNASWTAGADAR